MSQDPLRTMLRMLDARSATRIGSEDIAGWPTDVVDALTAPGVLRQAGLASMVECEGCDEACQEDVVFSETGAGEEPRAFVICHGGERLGAVPVPRERLHVWTLGAGALAAHLSAALQARGGVEECVPDRLWWLGRPVLQGRRIDAFLARGATWQDAGDVFAAVGRLRECSRPVVLVPTDVPTTDPFGPGAQVLSLVRLLSIEAGALLLDVSAVEEEAGASVSVGPPVAEPRLIVKATAIEFDGRTVVLGELPLKLITLLAEAKGNVVAKGDIAQALWGDGGEYYITQIRQHAKAINDACRAASNAYGGPEAPLVRAKRGVGYYVALDEDEIDLV